MIELAKDFEDKLSKHILVATGTTGLKVMQNTSLEVKRCKSGPLGGDQEIGAMVANHDVDMVIFLRDPLTAQPHEPDISALLRLCDVYKVPLSTNTESAINAIFIKSAPFFRFLIRFHNNYTINFITVKCVYI